MDKLYREVETLLRKSISDEYTREITENIFSDVVDDIETSADESYNECDVKLAIGRALLRKMGVYV